MSFFRSLWDFSASIFGVGSKSAKLVFVGLDNTGKTTLIHILNVDFGPKDGYPEPITIDNTRYTLVDTGGMARRPLKAYLPGTAGIVFMVDASDPDRFQAAKELLHTLVQMEEVGKKTPFLILGNNIDHPSAVSEEELRRALRISLSDTGSDIAIRTTGKGQMALGDETRPVELFMCSVIMRQAMDIHRCRFVPYNPQAINALAFSHPSSAEVSGRGVPTLRLAIGRANGDIEIWNPLRGTWLQESILRGGKDRSIEGLAWTQDPREDEDDESGFKTPGKLRLFSIGSSSVVTEWNLEEGRPARHSSGNFGEIWCLAAQPRWKAQKSKDGKLIPPLEGEYTGQHLAVGCADGSIVILSTQDGDLRYLRTMRPSTKRARVLNITFQDRNTAVAGYADSTIRVFDIRNGMVLRTISMGKGSVKGAKELLVWSVKCLPNGTIVSGDSAGEIRFWDAKNYSLIQRIQGHQADVLDIAVSADGESVISGGADQRTTIYKLESGKKGDKSRRWAEVAHRRYHTHDVKAFAVYETKDISIVVSGGLDTIPVVVPLREFGAEHHRKLSNLPQIPQIASSASSRLLMSWWDREVSLWQIAKRSGGGDDFLDGSSHKLVGKILFQGEESLSAATLSSDGKLLVAATVSEVKMFGLRQRKGDDKHVLRVQKLELPPAVAKHGAKNLHISPDRQWLCLVRPNNDIYLAKIVGSSDENAQILPKLIELNRTPRQIRHKDIHGTLGQYERNVRSIAFSDDSRILASGDLGGFIDSWILEDVKEPAQGVQKTKVNGKVSSDSSSDESSDDDDAPVVLEGQRWIPTPSESPIPRLKAGVLLLSFRPSTHTPTKVLTNGANSQLNSPSSGADRLMVLTTEHQLSEFDVLKGKLSDWSRRNPKAYLPNEFTTVKDRAMGAIWDINQTHDRLWLYGPTWMWMFDLSQDFPSSHEAMGEQKASNKRKREEEERMKTNSGAGDRMPLSKSDVGLGRKIRKTIGHKETSEVTVIDLKKERDRDILSEDDHEQYDASSAANDSTLARLRREQLQLKGDESEDEADGMDEEDTAHNDQQLPNGTSSHPPSLTNNNPQVAFAVVVDNRVHLNGHALPHERQETKESSAAFTKPESAPPPRNPTNPDSVLDHELEPQPQSKQPRQKRRWWHTHKYRDILGITPLGLPLGSDADQDLDEEGFGLEVVVVERPLWDVELPGRYIRDYE
ncbi:U3 small nucleolar RNA-associated protein [Emmonsiellopsis sp. PD_33]|nr:U3 small nucleolar RNA-associated protein [Emmonsiellopsis sp. PD_33]